MGSHLMHLVIGNEVSAHLTDVDRTAFLLGNLAPDATTSKQNTHYYAGRHEDMTRGLDLDQYWVDSADENQSFRLGYYCHLVADEIWLQGFFELPPPTLRLEVEDSWVIRSDDRNLIRLAPSSRRLRRPGCARPRV